MNIILLSGGSGKRLWPLSNECRSKQFIQFFKSENGASESMAQRVYRQLRKEDPDAVVTVATSKAQLSTIRNQLGTGINISVEPDRRDTFPAIALAAAYLADVLETNPEEPVIVCPIDSYANGDYFHELRIMAEQAKKEDRRLVLMGIEPTYPSEKYGYIIPKSKEKISDVLMFREKPSLNDAVDYIAKGALWNSGVFAFRLQYMLDKAHALIDFTDYADLLNKYSSLEKNSFDYAVLEREPNIQVIRFCGQWKDIGTWNTLTEELEESSIGNAHMDGTCKNVHIINELSIPILAMGLENVVISASPDGILVSDKEKSSYIKPFVDAFDQQTMYAEKSWGSYHVLDVDTESLTIKVTLKPGHRMNYHNHQHRNEVWVVISGTGYTVVDGMKQNISVGDVVAMESGCCHTVIAETELKLIEVQLGKEINVDDKQQFAMPGAAYS